MEERELGPEDATLNIYKSVTFTTPDSSKAILAFYKKQLEDDGWKSDDFQPDPQALLFSWTSYEQPPATYWIDVQTHQGDSGGTQVRIDLRDGAGVTR